MFFLFINEKNNIEPFAINYSNISPIIDEASAMKIEDEDSILKKFEYLVLFTFFLLFF